MWHTTLIRCVVLCAVLLVLALVPSWSQDSTRGKKYALLVGVTEYDSNHFSPLKFPGNDVEEMADAARCRACYPLPSAAACTPTRSHLLARRDDLS